MGLYAISGCPRSGTSLMMDCFRSAFGDERLLGWKFPKEVDPSLSQVKKPGETNEQFSLRMYARKIMLPEKELSNSKDLNPKGFWEDGRCTVTGFFYKPQLAEVIQELAGLSHPLYVKLVSQAISLSDPNYIEKVVYMIRDPKVVAKSQERLKRKDFINEKGNKIVENTLISSPEMFIKVTVSAAKWFLANPNIPLHIVDYKDLISKPKEELLKVQEFIGEGNFASASSKVDPKLNRSKPGTDESGIWEEAEKIYELFKKREFQKLVEYAENPRLEINRQKKKWLCFRYMHPVVESHCKKCKNNPEFRQTLREYADQHGILWQQRPCAYEVAYDLEHDLISIDESIQNNFWEEENVTKNSSTSPRGDFRTSRIQPVGSSAGLRAWAQHRGKRRKRGARPFTRE